MCSVQCDVDQQECRRYLSTFYLLSNHHVFLSKPKAIDQVVFVAVFVSVPPNILFHPTLTSIPNSVTVPHPNSRYTPLVRSLASVSRSASASAHMYN